MDFISKLLHIGPTSGERSQVQSQSGKGLRSPVEKASEVSSPTSKSLAKSVSKQTISSDSCSFNSALQSSDTDATATADYDSAGESEFVLAPDSHEQKENLDLTLLANCLDGIHIASPQSDSHSPHDCSLFAVKFTKGELSAQDQEELSSEPCDQENEESLSGILNLSSISSEEITRTTPLEYLASEQNSEKKRLSAAKNFAAESDEIDPPVDAFDILESQLQAENPFNESNVSENRRSFSGILNVSDVSYEEIPVVGLIPNRDLNASLQNHANSEVEANNTTETVETSDQLIENRPHFEETSLVPRPLDLTAENIVVLQTADNKNDLNESVEKLSINRSHLEETSIDPRPLDSTTESIVVLQTADSKKDLNDPVEEISSKEFDRPLENSVLNSSLNATAPPAPVELEHPVDSTFQLNSVIRTSSSSEHQSESRESVQEEIDEESPKKSLEEKSVKIGTHSPDETNTSVASVYESLKSHEIHSNSFTSCTTDKNVINSTLINEPAVGKCSQVDDKTQESPEIGTKFTVESSDGSRSTLHIDSVATNLFDPSTEIKETAEVSSDLFQTVSPLIQSEVLSENSDCTVEIQNSNIVTNIQEDLKGLSPSDSKCNNADLNNDSPANVSISKELSVTITDDLTHTVISDLLTKAGNLVSSDSQDLLNGSHKQDNLSFNCNLESECKDTKPECAEAVSLVNEVILATVSNPSGCKEVQSPENVLNVQTSCLDASVDKLNESTVQAAPDIVEVDQLNSTSFSKAVTDDELNGEGIAGVQKEGILENEDGIFCKEPVTGSKTSFEFVKKSSETLNNYQETEEKIQQTITANLQEPLKFDQIVAAEETEKIVLRSIGTQLNLNVVASPSVADTELNGNIIKSETNLLSPVSGTPCQESSVEAKEDLVSERSDLNASSTSLDESLPLLDAIDESFEVRTEDKFVNLNSSLKSSENQCPEQEKIVSTKFCIANLNKSATDETILESAILDNNTVEKTNTSVSEPVENCLKPAALNGHNTLGYDLKNNNSPEVISVPDSPKSIGISSSSNTTQVEEGTCYGINAITENNNRSLSQNLDDVPTPKTVEGPVVGELKTEVSADLAKDILQEAFNKLSIEIRGDLSKNQSSLIEEPSKLPDNSHFNDNPTINQVDLSIYTEEKQLVEESDVVEIESKSEILTVDSKDSQIESLEPICEKNENIEELNFDDSLTEQALNLSREILLNSEDQMSDNFTVEMDNRMSSSAKTDGPKSNRVSFESNGHGVGEDLDKTFEMQSESPTFDSTANSSEAGPITAEEFTIPASAFQFDLDSLPCGVRNARLAGAGLTRNSLYVKFDPIVGKILANTENSPGPFLPPPTTERLEGSSLERTPMKNPALDEKLISITPCSTVGSGNANSSFTEQLDSSIDSESNKTVENATLNKTDPDITQRVRNLSFEAESKQAASSLTPQTNKHQTSKTTPRGGTVVSQEYYLKELEKLQDLMSKQEQGYQEELNRNTEKMEKLQIEVSSLKKEMHSKAKALSQSEVVLGEYERTIAKLVAQNEADKKQFELLKEKLIQERDTVTIHLNNTEIAFNDVHQKYERSKLVIEEMKNVQDTLKASNQEYEKLLKAQEDKYNKLRSHVAGQLEKASHEMETMIRNHKDENDRLRARLKQAEIANKSLESANEQKTKENKELTQILDELIGKVGADGV